MHYFAFFLCLLPFVYAAPLERVMVDMSYPYNERVQNHPMWKKFNMTVVANGTEVIGIWAQAEEMTTATHMGTHMDSPSHFVRGGIDTDRIAIEDFIAPAAVINIASRAAGNPDAAVTVQDLQNWELTTGQSLNGTVVLMDSGWGAKWENRAQFIGTTEEDASRMRFPGFSSDAARWLVEHRSIKGVGVDTLSIDVGSSHGHRSHLAILGKGLYALENVANIDKIPAYGALLHVFPMKISRASGAPTRVVAVYPKVIFHA